MNNIYDRLIKYIPAGNQMNNQRRNYYIDRVCDRQVLCLGARKLMLNFCDWFLICLMVEASKSNRDTYNFGVGLVVHPNFNRFCMLEKFRRFSLIENLTQNFHSWFHCKPGYHSNTYSIHTPISGYIIVSISSFIVVLIPGNIQVPSKYLSHILLQIPLKFLSGLKDQLRS